MPLTPFDRWTESLRETLRAYEEGLLRQVLGRLCKPRNQWPVEELIDRGLATVGNPAVLDRRLEDLEPAARGLLALIAHSRQPRWHVGNLVEMGVILGHEDGLAPVRALFEAGLLYPELADGTNGRPRGRMKDFDHWLGQGNAGPLWVFVHPAVSARALGTDAGLPECPGAVAIAAKAAATAAVHEADGLEWPLRLAVLWQQVAFSPLRRTQTRDFFKRDLERLRSDPLLTAAPAENLSDLPDPGLLAVSLCLAAGLVEDHDGELSAADFPRTWGEGLPAAVASLWSALLHQDTWSPESGWQATSAANPFPAAYLLSLLLLSRLAEDAWAEPEQVAGWVVERHPYWRSNAAAGRGRCQEALEAPRAGLTAFLLGLAYQLRLVQAVKGPEQGWLIRLSSLGRWLLGLGNEPDGMPSYPQILLVQPNLEILAFAYASP